MSCVNYDCRNDSQLHHRCTAPPTFVRTGHMATQGSPVGLQCCLGMLSLAACFFCSLLHTCKHANDDTGFSKQNAPENKGKYAQQMP